MAHASSRSPIAILIAGLIGLLLFPPVVVAEALVATIILRIFYLVLTYD